MTSSVLRIPVQWNVTLLVITVQVLGTLQYCTVDSNAVFLVNKYLLLTKVIQNLYCLENHIL